MTIASKRKPCVPCELCEHYKESRYDHLMFCDLHHHRATEADGCTWGKVKEDR